MAGLGHPGRLVLWYTVGWVKVLGLASIKVYGQAKAKAERPD